LATPDNVDPFSISKKNVAELYEMWCYLEVLKCLEQIVGRGDYSKLFKVNNSKFSLNLVEGEESRVDWLHTLHGRKVQISLWYNRTFSPILKDGAQSWSKDYKPDISMHVRPVGEVIIEENRSSLDVWVHFDAKYKLEVVEENIDSCDVFCALTNSEEANILSAMLAKRLGAAKVMALINKPSYAEIVQSGMIDVAISPQTVTIGSLLAYVRRGDVVQVHSLRGGSANSARESNSTRSAPYRSSNRSSAAREAPLKKSG
jgi:hypothetical protein